MKGRIFFVPEHIAITPKEGHAYVDRWWLVHTEKGFAFYCRDSGPSWVRTDGPKPQCNKDKALVEHLKSLYKYGDFEGDDYMDLRIEHHKVVFEGHAIEYQRKTRKQE